METTKITLQAARVNAGYTQDTAAKLLGISKKTLVSWEKGRTFPSAQKIERICEVYGVHYDQLKFLPKVSPKAVGE